MADDVQAVEPGRVDRTTKRVDRASELRETVKAHARIARHLGHDSLTFADKVRLAYWNAFQHDCLNTAKATAFSAIFAIFPVLGFVTALVTMLPYTAAVRVQLALFFDRVLPASVSPLFEHFFITAHGSPQSAGVLLVAAFVSVGGAAGVLATLMEGFRRAYNMSDACWGPGIWGVIRRQLQSYLLVPIAVVPLAVASLLIVFGHFLLLEAMRMSPTGWDRGFYLAANAARWVGSLGATAAVLAVVYRYGVPVKPSWRAVLPGAAFATGTWFVSTLLFGVYVTRFANYSRVYGPLGTGIVLLVWLFLTALTVLCGAELNAELGRDRITGNLPKETPLREGGSETAVVRPPVINNR